jgi:uncharacterized coiled-coil protein SlyX
MTEEQIQSLIASRDSKISEAEQLTANMSNYIAEYKRLFDKIQADVSALTEAIGDGTP